jgi:hypothetical protein
MSSNGKDPQTSMKMDDFFKTNIAAGIPQALAAY